MSTGCSVFFVGAAALLSLAFAPSMAGAQEAGADATPAPVAAPAATTVPAPEAARLTVIDREYDGKTHLTLTPYVWLPSINGTFEFNVPTLPHKGAGTTVINAQVGPNGYLSKLNFAIMGAFDLRKGDVDAFGDFINLNASTGTTFVSSVSGPLGKVQIPIDAGSSGHIASTIWELGAGYTLAHTHDASLEAFTGWRQASIKGTLDWNVTLGKNGLIQRSGSIVKSDTLSDILFGLRGKVALGDSGWFVPYYGDIGAGANNSSWQAYGGIGKTFHSSSFLLLFRNLSYNLPGSSYIRSVRFGGPLVGYTFSL